MPDPAAPLFISKILLQAKRLEIDAARQLADRAELVAVIGQLIDALQRERGASSIFLASKGNRFVEVRRTAIDAARIVETQLRTLLAIRLDDLQGATSRMLSLTAWVVLGLDALDALRSQIDRQALSAHDSVAAFSRLIAGPLELIFHIADATLLPDISRLLVSLLHLIQGKEAAGQERAVGALMFASATCGKAHQERATHLIDAQERSLQVFAEFADPALRARWETQQLTPAVARLERLRRTLGSARPGAVLDSNMSDMWFDACSERIGDLWQIEVELVARLRESCETRVREAQQDLQDSEGMLRRLRDKPPAHTDAVAQFFDIAVGLVAVPEFASTSARGESTSLVELIQSQSARLARVEAELEAARRTLHERKVIERAKGVLMSRLAMTEEGAFRALQKTSMDQNRRLVDVAEATLLLPDIAFAKLREQSPAKG